jgi:hypothetical protein
LAAAWLTNPLKGGKFGTAVGKIPVPEVGNLLPGLDELLLTRLANDMFEPAVELLVEFCCAMLLAIE